MGWNYVESEDDKEKTVSLDNTQIAISQFNKAVESLSKNQRIVETSKDNFHIVERLFS